MQAGFPVLGNAGYATYIGPLTHKGGANPTAHIAEVRYPVQTAPITSVVKLMQPDGMLACNEALAWLFLRCVGMSSPKNAAILALTEAKAVNILGRKLVPKSLVRDGHVLAWASQQLEFRSIQAIFAGCDGDARWLALLNTVEGAAIAAFDETFLNIDRNLGNVLFISNESCVAIDHELCFASQNWLLGDLKQIEMDSDSLRVLKQAARTRKIARHELAKTYNNMVFHAHKHAKALQACADHMGDLIARVYTKDAAQLTPRVLSFITERTALRWIEDRLGVV